MDTQYKLGTIELFTKEQAESMSVDIAFKKAPLIIHQSFCAELVRIAKEAEKKPLNEIPGAGKILIAIDVIQNLYPQLKFTPELKKTNGSDN
ncbi:MAG: hypothetical protein IID16_00990 [Candidatus Marinimicrobia bacterium]|nr:hypothetical protein [Candidatus Neomarinimicrobiota bacterium]